MVPVFTVRKDSRGFPFMEEAAGIFWFICRWVTGGKLVCFSTDCVRTVFTCSSAFRARISFVRILFSSRRSDDFVRARSLPLSQICDGLCVPVRSCPPAWYSGSTVSFVPCTGKRFLTSPENPWAILSTAVPTADCICHRSPRRDDGIHLRSRGKCGSD